METFWRLDSSRLHPGDIILTTVPHSLKHTAIRAVTRSPYTHAIIVTSPPLAVEAVGAGVVRVNLGGYIIRNQASVRILRLSTEAPAAAREVAEYAESKILRAYTLKDAVFSVVARAPESDTTQYFCSDLVARAYQHARTPLTAKEPKKTTPGDLAESRLLKDVTGDCLVAASLLSLATASGALDDFAPGTPHHMEVQLKRRIYEATREVRVEYRLDADDYEGLLKLLIAGAASKADWVIALDAAVTGEIIKSGLLAVPGSASDMSEALRFELRLLRAIISGGHVTKEEFDAWENEINTWIDAREETIAQLTIQWTATRQLYLEHGLETFFCETLLNDIALIRASKGLESFRRCKVFVQGTRRLNFAP